MRVLFFSPFANIWEHAFPEARIAEAFGEDGIDVAVVRCGRYLSTYCVAMSAAGVDALDDDSRKQRVCSSCVKRADLIATETGIRSFDLDGWITGEDRAETDRILAATTPDNWADLEVDGLAIGRFAAYELHLKEKLVSTELTAHAWEWYPGQLRNTLLTYFAARRLFASVERPDAVVVYNDHYSVNHAWSAAALRAGITSYSIHAGGHMIRRIGTLTMNQSERSLVDVFDSDAWRTAAETPIDECAVSLVGSHLDGLLQAHSAFAYSSGFQGTTAEELRSRLDIPAGRKVLLAAMSSEDEALGLELIGRKPKTSVKESLFGNQFEWIRALYRYAEARQDIHLVIRPHPRMFPNKREQMRSPTVPKIEAVMQDAPANVTYNLPGDGIGIYDLVQIIDVLLNYRSSVGVELGAFGIPVVRPTDTTFATYPAGIDREASTIEAYGEEIDAAIGSGWSMETARRAVRWYAFLFSRHAVDLDGSAGAQPIAFRPKQPGPALQLYNWAAFVFLQYGPLVRERRALKSRDLAENTKAVLLDVIRSSLPSVADSSYWQDSSATWEEETQALTSWLRSLTNTIWAPITEPGSLAQRIRDGLGEERD